MKICQTKNAFLVFCNIVATHTVHTGFGHSRTILHKILAFTGTLNYSRLKKNWENWVTNEFRWI